MNPRLRIENGVAWIGDRRMPEAASTHSSDYVKSHPGGKLMEFRSRSFELPFESGWTVKVSWGRGPGIPPSHPFTEEAESATVVVNDRDDRVVVWSEDGQAIGKSLDHAGQQPDVPAARVLELIDEVATWPTDYLPIMDRN